MITDPWTVPASSRPAAASVVNNAVVVTSIAPPPPPAADQFEDNFTSVDLPSVSAGISAPSTSSDTALPDSDEYLASLERKLTKLRTDSGVLEQLTARRENCVERLLQGDIDLPTAAEFGFDPNAESVDQQQAGVVGDLVRHIRPEQAVNAAELLHLIQFDQLQPVVAVVGDAEATETTTTTTTEAEAESTDSISH